MPITRVARSFAHRRFAVLSVLPAVLLSAVLLTAVGGCAPLVDEPETPVELELPESAPERLEHDVRYLAATEREGRGIGTDGVADAERYIRRRFEALGLGRAPHLDGFTQPFSVYRHGFDPERTVLRVLPESEPGAPKLVARPGGEMRVLPFSAEGNVIAPLDFAGYAITAPERGWDDFEDRELEGAAGLALRYEPWLEDPVGPYGRMQLSEHASINRKAREAANAGAEALLVVTGPKHADDLEDLRPFELVTLDPERNPLERIRNPAEIPVVQISRSFAERMLRPLGVNLQELQRSVHNRAEPVELETDKVRIELSIVADPNPEVVAVRNVVGYIPGEADDEVIVIGAHHDHLGAFGEKPEAVYHGADDNASGVAAVLELAKRFSVREEPPPVGLVFVTFSAEEVGLLGSRAFVDEIVEQAWGDSLRVRRMINLDMIGRNPDKPLRIFDSEEADDSAITLLAEELELAVEHRSGEAPPNSDHYPFYRAGISILALYTGLHEDYHHVSDTANLLEYERMARMTELLKALILNEKL